MEKGDFTVIAAFARESGERLVNLLASHHRFARWTWAAAWASRPSCWENLYGQGRQLVDVANSQNQNKSGGTVIAAAFMRVTVFV